MVYEGAGDAYFSGNLRHVFCTEPSGIKDLVTVDLDIAAGVISGKTDHEGVWERPWLTSEITDVFDVNARFFLYFSPHCIFQGFTWLNEASKDAIEPLLEARRTGKKGFAVPLNKYNNGR